MTIVLVFSSQILMNFFNNFSDGYSRFLFVIEELKKKFLKMNLSMHLLENLYTRNYYRSMMIRAKFLVKNLFTDTNINKNTHHSETNTFLASL